MPIPFSVSWVQELIRAIFDPESVDLVDIASEVSPAIVLEVDRREWAFLKREFHFSGSLSQGAVAAQLSSVGIINSPISGAGGSSDFLTMIYMVKNTSPSLVADLILGTTAGNVPGAVSSAPVTNALDSRLVPDPAGTAVPRAQSRIFNAASVAGIGNGVFTLIDTLAAGERLTREQHGLIVVLAPGSYLGLQGQALNTAMSGTFWLYERSTRGKGRYII